MASTTVMFLSGASTVGNFVADRSQAGAVLAQGEYSKRIAEWNADIADLQAKDAVDRGAESERRQRVTTRGVLGKQRAGLAAQGIEVNADSALQIQEDTAAMGELDAMTIRNNAAREAWGYNVQASNFRTQGDLDMTAAKNQAAGIRGRSWSTLMTGVANTYGLSRDRNGKSSGSKKMKAPKSTQASDANFGLTENYG